MGAAVRGRRAVRASGVSDVTNVTSGACFPREPRRAGARARVANVQRYRRWVLHMRVFLCDTNPSQSLCHYNHSHSYRDPLLGENPDTISLLQVVGGKEKKRKQKLQKLKIGGLFLLFLSKTQT